MKHNIRNVKLLLVALFLLNIFDAVLTWITVKAGVAYEINIIPSILIDKGIYHFLCIKIGLVSVFLVFLYIRTDESSVKFIKILQVLVVLFGIVVALGLTSVMTLLL